MPSDEILNLALELIRAGKKENARAAIKQALEKNPDNVAAWGLLVQVAQDSGEEMTAIREVLRLKPEDEWAQRYLAGLVDKEALNRIADLIRMEQNSQAAFLLEQMLERSPDNPDAWALKARLAEKREDAITALEEVLRLSPQDERARQYLTRLTKEQKEIEQKRIDKAQKKDRKEDKRSRTSAPDKPAGEKRFKLSSDLIFGLIGLVLLLSLVCFVIGYPMLPEDQRFLGDLWLKSADNGTESPFVAGSCEALINKALEVSDIGCQKIGRNEICYGNYDLTANVVPDFSDQFTVVGDVIPVTGVKQFYASPLDLVKNLWGVAVLKLQANLPGTVPGQNVTFLVFGDTSIDNVSGDMSAFYFTSGFSGVRCSEVPFDGMLIEMPDGSGVSFQANGVDFMLQGDAILQAQPGEELTISMVEGSGLVRAEDQIQEMGPGTSISVPMSDDLNPTGPPSEPVPLPDDDALLGCHLLGVGCPPGVEAVIRSPTSTPGGAELGAGLPRTYTPAPINPDIPTNTPVPVPPGQPTNTSVPLPTNTSPPLPGDTSQPSPIDTSPPGATTTNTLPPPTPTNTSLPPTAEVSICDGIMSGSVGTGGTTMSFTINNNTPDPILISTITLSWPTSQNGSLQEITIDSIKIFFGNPVSSSPFTISDTSSPPWSTGSGTRKLESGQSRILSFIFETSAGWNSVDVKFNNGCVIHK
ncbi:MAG: tetratricopeptide repeat protein [Anaerolineales bacterium]|jgi:tetratricopeptide (TPR) repeat protein